MPPKSRKRPKRRSGSSRTRIVSPFGFDLPLLILTLVLLAIGLLFVFESSVVEAFQNYQNRYHFAQLQLQWIVVGLGVMFGVSLTPIELIKKLAFPAFVVSLVLLILVLVPGIGVRVGGAQRWINLGLFNLQPSELAKLSMILYFSALFESKKQVLTPFLLSTGLVLGVIMLQPDLGTSLVIGSLGLSLYFLAGAPLSVFGLISGIGLLAVIGLIITSEYRMRRLLTFLNLNHDPLGSSYHIRQIIFTLGSGGLLGNGIGRSLQRFDYLPEAMTDSIFAVIAEETGFVGSLIVLSLFGLLIWRGVKIALSATTDFEYLIAAGAMIMISTQALLNLGAISALVPLTGIPLPFISYGGSSLVISLAAVGLLLNVSKRQGKQKYGRR